MTDDPKYAATAACGAYLLVALADARVESVEEARFLGGVVNDDAFRTIPADALAGEYNRLIADLQADWNGAEAEILGAIAKMRGDANGAEAVKAAARHAIVADERLKPQEEFVLERIARALGVDPDDL